MPKNSTTAEIDRKLCNLYGLNIESAGVVSCVEMALRLFIKWSVLDSHFLYKNNLYKKWTHKPGNVAASY